MKKYMRFDPKFTAEKLSKMDLNQINEQKTALENKLKTAKFPVLGKNGFWAKRDFFESVVAAMDAEINKRTYTPKETETDQETDVPSPVVENPTPTMAKETAPETSNAGEKNVKKVLHKKSPKTIDKPKKNNYINTTNKTKTTKTGDKTMITITNPAKTLTQIQGFNGAEVKKYEKMCLKALKKAKNDMCVVGDKQITTAALAEILDALDYRYNVLNGNWAKVMPNVPRETLENTGAIVKKKLHKNVENPIDKPKKNNYINSTNKTTTTNKKENKTMNKNEINSLVKTVTIAPNAVKKIMVAQKKNKTNIDARYWGGWATVRTGMNAAYNDYEKYQNLETEWLELRSQLGGMKSDKYHFCWGLINKNRVGVKQEPNATLRFIKNVKIRIAMAKDVLANKYSRAEITSYMNGLSMNYKIKYGLV